MAGDSKNLKQLREAYSMRSNSLSRPATKYTFLWDIGRLCRPGPGGASPWCFPGLRWPQRFQLAQAEVRGLAEVRAELAALRSEVNQELWRSWEQDSAGLEVEAAMLSGQAWRFTLGEAARGSEVRQRVAELAGVRAAELRLLCGGEPVEDAELLMASRREQLQGPPPQLTVVRMVRHRALSCSTDCSLKLWDFDPAVCVHTLKGHADGVVSLAVDWAAGCAASGAHDCTLRLWDLDHGACVQMLRCPGHPAFCVALDYDARRALSGSWDKTLKLWDLDRGVCIQTFEGHTGLVTCCALCCSLGRCLSGSHDGTLRLWNLDGTDCQATLSGHTDKVNAVDVDWASLRALSASHDRMLRLWDLAAGACLATLRGHEDVVPCLSVDWASERALSGSWDRCAKLWDLAQGSCLQTLAAEAAVTSVSTDWAAGRAITCSSRSLKLWDLEGAACTETLAGHADSGVSVGLTEAATCVVLSPLA